MDNILISIIIFSSAVLIFGIYCLIYSSRKIRAAAGRGDRYDDSES